MNEKLSLIEEKLLKKELAEIKVKLGKIGIELANVFSKYGKINGQHKDEMDKFILENIISSSEGYYAGYTTHVGVNFSPKLPDFLRELIVEYAVNDFLGKAEEILCIVEENFQQRSE